MKPKREQPPKKLTLIAPINLEGIAPVLEGADQPLPTFSMIAYTGGKLAIKGWKLPVVVDLSGVEIAAQQIPTRLNHSESDGVGHTTAITIEEGKLLASGVVSRKTDAAREVVASAQSGFPWQASIGASVQDAEYIMAGRTVRVNGRDQAGPFHWAKRSTLGEISFVDLGADTQTSVRIAAMAREVSDMVEPEDDKTTDQQDDQKDQDATGGNGQEDTQAESKPVEASAKTSDEPDVPDHIKIRRDEAACEEKRIVAIRKVCGEEHGEIAAQAISEGRSSEWAELKVLRAKRPEAPAVHMADEAITGKVLEAACMLTSNEPEVEKQFDEKTLEAAAKRFPHGIGMQELLVEAAWANGWTGRSFRGDSRGVMRHAFRPMDVQAAFSSVDLTGILGNTANKSLLRGFMSVEQAWRRIAAIGSVKDFKTHTSYRMIGPGTYEEIAAGGEIPHGKLEEESFTNQAKSYGKILGVDRRDIINDDLGAITTVPQRHGRGAGLKLNNVFWTAFLDNSTHFASGNSNKITDATYALGITGMDAAVAAFLALVDSNDEPTGVDPKILLAPLALQSIAKGLYTSKEMRDTTASKKATTDNPHVGLYEPVISRYLSNSNYTGYSATSWYLLADPQDLATIEVVFLNGQESPTVETTEADFSTLGIQMRGYHDFGVALQDPKAGVMATIA